jgi:hypothetical protein
MGCIYSTVATSQNIEAGANLQVYSSSPNKMYKEQFIPQGLPKNEFTNNINYSNIPSFAVGASFRKPIQEKWALYFNPTYEWIQMEFKNSLKSISELTIYEIKQKYQLQYLTPNIMVGYFFKGHRKISPYLKVGSSLHFLLNQKYTSTPYVESPSEFNSTFVSLMCEFGTRLILKNNQKVELAFLIDIDVNGFEGSRSDQNRLFPEPSTLFSAGLRVQYFPFN